MATVLPKLDPTEKHTHLEIHSLIDGGYVVREGRFDGCSDSRDDTRWMFRQERAAFANLEDAVAWMGAQMRKKSPDPAPQAKRGR
jgi:hypothetical protein